MIIVCPAIENPSLSLAERHLGGSQLVFGKLKSAVTRIVGGDEQQTAGLREISAEVLRHHPDADIDYLRRINEYANRVRRLDRHENPVRAQHCLSTAYMLAHHKLDLESIGAALLQDLMVHKPNRREGIAARFGNELAAILDGLARIAAIQFRERGQNQPANFHALLAALALDVRVLIVALANTCQTMRTLERASDDERRRYSTEALDIYAPLANRIGMNPFKTELEELAFFYLEPTAYHEIENQRSERHRRNKLFLNQTEAALTDILTQKNIDAHIYSRVKHHFSIHKKMRHKQRSIDGIYDYYAYRIITDSVSNCYRCFGILHNQWRHIPGRIKDFIATPKNNLYQALHTTLISENGTPFEIQIKTTMMHRLAEEGVTVYWTYKCGHITSTGNQNVAAEFAKLLQENRDIPDTAAFQETIRGQLNTDEIIVFTPHGDLKTLPKGATALDFAYLIHTDLGHQTKAAKVDGRMVPPQAPLPPGCIVEIITDSHQEPSPEWLKWVKTNGARSKIRVWLRKAQRDEAAKTGRRRLIRELARFDTNLDTIPPETVAIGLQTLGLKSLNELYTAIGFGRYTAARAARPFLPADAQQPLVDTPVEAQNQHINVQGEQGSRITFARCCNPIPGDDIVGLIAKGNRISVHQRECANLQQQYIDPERLVEVTWNTGGPEELFQAKLKIETSDRPSMIAEITRPFAEFGINVLELNVTQDQDRQMRIFDFVIQIGSSSRLRNLMRELGQIKGVSGIQRV